LEIYSEGELDEALRKITTEATRLSLSTIAFEPEASRTALRAAVVRLLESFPNILSRTYIAPPSLAGLGSHGDIYANLLLRFGSALNLAGHKDAAETIWSFNKTLHGLDFYAYGEVPKVLLLSHPVGTVVGRASLGTALVLYQGVTVGASRQEDQNSYPVFEGRTVLYAHSTVLGRSRIGDGVVFAANSMIVDCDVPPNTLVAGHYPNHRFLPGAEVLLESHLVSRG